MPQSQLCSPGHLWTPQDAAGPPVTLNIVAGSNSGSSARQSQQRAGPQCQCYSWRYYWLVLLVSVSAPGPMFDSVQIGKQPPVRVHSIDDKVFSLRIV